MEAANRKAFRLRACRTCGGDAFLDDMWDVPEWRCLQCGRFVSDEVIALNALEPLGGSSVLQPRPAGVGRN